MNLRTLIAVCCLAASCSLTAQQTAPRVFLVNPNALAQAKAHPTAQLLTLAKQEADAALKVPALSVTAKSQTPPSGDKRDYMSMGTYWWPNPDTPNHLPYVRKDGYHNPETKNIPDHDNLELMAKAVNALALEYYLSGDEHYAAHAALLLRAWFLAPATAMNPNMQYAQYVAGINTGRGSGILDSRNLPKAIDAAGMLAGSKNWSAADDAALHGWFDKYYTWLTTAKHAADENNAPNNHGSWFQEQAAPIALYLGKTDGAKKMAERVIQERIPAQIDAQGLQKYELARTNSFSYSSFNLQALTQFAATEANIGIDVYQPAKPGAPGILTAINALIPYDSHHKWPHQQITAGKENGVCPALYFANARYHDPQLTDAIKRFQCEPTASILITSLGN
jgi:hypothetical protein